MATITRFTDKIPPAALRRAVVVWIAVNLCGGALIASPQLSQAAQAVSDLAPLCAQYLRLKAEGKL